ncbi:MAG TPA: isocitrate lyase/phosphoenolpyruvate mutase family protein [Gaiellaceae bacterium]|nr:isocitrate lyase/phosphoenolpyruvate mutase family protein [Gaiellaceae bacterium]
MDRDAKAELLRGFHHAPPILVLPNAWDVGSAQALAALPGCRALATTSGGVARSLGFEDGEKAPAEEMVRAASRIAAAVDVPVTADLERGYGDAPATARAAWDAGIVGMNLEDSTGGALVPVDAQVALIRAVKKAVPGLVLNARVDIFLRKAGGVDEAVERANAYLAAGADCTYPIFCPPETVGPLVKGISGPINVLLGRGMQSAQELEQLGVARVTWGSGLAQLAYDEATRVAASSLSSVSLTASPPA